MDKSILDIEEIKVEIISKEKVIRSCPHCGRQFKSVYSDELDLIPCKIIFATTDRLGNAMYTNRVINCPSCKELIKYKV